MRNGRRHRARAGLRGLCERVQLLTGFLGRRAGLPQEIVYLLEATGRILGLRGRLYPDADS